VSSVPSETLLQEPVANEVPVSDDAAALQSDEDAPIQIYGFADFSYRQLFGGKSTPYAMFLNREPSFFVGNANIYFSSKLSSRWRSLMEVRFTYLPNGTPVLSMQTASAPRIDNQQEDYTDFARPRPVGGIMLERVQLEYTVNSYLAFTLGQWLSPYGIWVVDHGSPVIIGVFRPFIIGSQLIPERQIGVMASGEVPIGDDTLVSYALGLSNGRSDFVAYEDLDGNKAVTARVALITRELLGDLQIGATFYRGRDTTGENHISTSADSMTSYLRVASQYDEVTYACDVRWLYEGLHLQTEWLLNDRRYTATGRPRSFGGGLSPDRRNWGGYGMLGYRTPWLTLMPYVKAEYSPEPTAQALGFASKIVIYSAGLNVRPVAKVVFKAEYDYGHFTGNDVLPTLAGQKISTFNLQAAWAF
jgi:opacity protein-like surface antigen